jgi:ERCC4-type nuclease
MDGGARPVNDSDTTIFVSPAEPKAVKMQFGERGDVSALPERYGVDFLWRTRGTWWGIQRKTVSDLLASLDDGRITREVAQMVSRVSLPTLVIEGRLHFTLEGRVAAHTWSKNRWTVKQWRGFLWSLASRGINVAYTSTTAETAEYVMQMADWSAKVRHTSVTARPKAVESGWGQPSNRDWGVFLLQSFDGVGAGVAGDIWDHFGRVPLRWDVSREELLAIKGMGPKRVDKMLATLDGGPLVHQADFVTDEIGGNEEVRHER